MLMRSLSLLSTLVLVCALTAAGDAPDSFATYRPTPDQSQYVPEGFFRPDPGAELPDSTPGAETPDGLFYNAAWLEGFPKPPFLPNGRFQEAYRSITGEDSKYMALLTGEIAGVATYIRWQVADPDAISATNDEPTTASRLAEFSVSWDVPAEGRQRFGILPMYQRGESRWPAERNGEPLAAAKLEPRGSFQGVVFQSGPRERVRFLRAAEEWASANAVGLTVPLSNEPFVLVTLEPPVWAFGAEQPFDFAVAGLPPQAIRRLPDGSDGAIRLLAFPLYESTVPVALKVRFAPLGSFSPAPSRLRSTITNRFEILGGLAFLTSTRRYRAAEGETIGHTEFVCAPDYIIERIASDPICTAEQLASGWIRLTPADGNPVSEITVELRQRFFPGSDMVNYVVPQDRSLSDIEELLVERPPHVALTHALVQGVERQPKNKPPARVGHHLTNDRYLATSRRPGQMQLGGYVRSTLSQQRRVDHEATMDWTGTEWEVREKLLFLRAAKDETPLFPNPLEVWLPEAVIGESVEFGPTTAGIAEAALAMRARSVAAAGETISDDSTEASTEPRTDDLPTTRTLEASLLTVEWSNPSEIGQWELSYRVGPERDETGRLALPVSVVKGMNVRGYHLTLTANNPLYMREAGDFQATGAGLAKLTEPLVAAGTTFGVEGWLLGTLQARPRPVYLQE